MIRIKASQMLFLNCALVILLALAINTTASMEIIEIGCKVGDITVNDTTANSASRDCAHRNCYCQLLDNALANLTGNSAIIITADVALASLFVRKDLVNVLIIGHSSPTVKCSDSHGGGLHFLSCHNCSIEGIIWDGCGVQGLIQNSPNPVIQFQNSSNVIIQNCSFRNSRGQAIVVAEVTGPGDVIIDQCEFVNNHYHGGHGAAIYHISNKELCSTINGTLMISNCNFTDNGDAQSIVFIGPSQLYPSIKNSVFQRNNGSAVYISNNTLTIGGNASFEDNLADCGGGIFVDNHSSIRFYKNSTTLFSKNIANDKGGAIYMSNYSSILLETASWVSFYDNNATLGGAVSSNDNCYITAAENCVINFTGNSAEFGGAMSLYNADVIFTNSIITFKSNNAKDAGGALYVNEKSDVAIKRNSTATFNENKASLGGAISCMINSNLKFDDNSVVAFNNNVATSREGGAIHIYENCHMTFEQYSFVIFSSNLAAKFGGAVHVFKSVISFKDHSKANFSFNSAKYSGGAMYLKETNLTLHDATSVTFNENSVRYRGGALYLEMNSQIIFKKYSESRFSGNSCKGQGGAIYCKDNSHFIVDESSSTIVSNNEALYGGAISMYNCELTFKGDSTISFYSNRVEFLGGVILSTISVINFQGNVEVVFNNNRARHGGGLLSRDNSTIMANENSLLTFDNNTASDSGGGVYLEANSSFTVIGNCNVTFSNNMAVKGGAMHAVTNSNICFKQNSIAVYTANEAKQYGGALYSSIKSDITIRHSAAIIFNINKGMRGGAVCIEKISHLLIDGNSTVSFNNNIAVNNGGGLFAITNSSITYMGNSYVAFNNNRASSGGAIGAERHCKISYVDKCTIIFYNNSAGEGGAVYLHDNTNAMHKGNSVHKYLNNTAKDNGGIIFSKENSGIICDEESMLTAIGNNATRGGAIYLLDESNMAFKGNLIATFVCNRAHYGGAMYSEKNCNITLAMDAAVTFDYNVADVCGGAVMVYRSSRIHLEGRTNVTLRNNIAGYSGAIHSEKYSTVVFSDSAALLFTNNRAIATGGAVGLVEYSNIELTGYSTVVFDKNIAKKLGIGRTIYQNNSHHNESSTITIKDHTHLENNGGAINLQSNSNSKFKGNTIVSFSYNSAQNEGGAIASSMSNILFTQYSQVNFIGNQAKLGGNIFSSNNSTIITDATVKFNNNPARLLGGKLYHHIYDVIIESNGIVTCNGLKMFPICINDICFCRHLDNALTNLPVSHDVVIELKTKVNLFSFVKLDNLTNFTIIGYNSPTVHCGKNGGLQFVSCHGCAFEGIAWNECGLNVNDIPAIKFENSSNIRIQNCSFHHSVNQAVVMSNVYGYVNIKHSKFVNNTHYRGYGAIIHYSTINNFHFPVKFLVSNCNFTNNTGALSVVHIERQNHLFQDTFFLSDNSFTDNSGTIIYITNQNLSIEGRNLFTKNQAENGSCIYANSHSAITFSNHSITKFDYNKGIKNGGAILLSNHASVLFDRNSVVEFNNNNVMNLGGCIYLTETSKVIFKENSNVLFNHNKAQYGGALYLRNDNNLIFNQKCNVTFKNNYADSGGAVYISQQSNISFTGNSSLKFLSNLANEHGGGICCHSYSILMFMENTSVIFYNNTAKYGGAVGAVSGVRFNNAPLDITTSIITRGTSSVTFVDNNASYGGAVYNEVSILFDENSTVNFINNTADFGGAICSQAKGKIIFQGNFIMALARRKVNESCKCNISWTLFEGNTRFIAKFTGNIAKRNGGAVYLGKSSGIMFSKEFRCKVAFDSNKALNGGAIYSEDNSSVVFGGKSTITFANNEAMQDGGAMDCRNHSVIIFTGCFNAKFYHNKAKEGGAIYVENNSSISFKQNSTTKFNDNTGVQHGGALFSKLNCTIYIEEYSSIFYDSNNAMINGGSIYVENNSVIISIGHSIVKFIASIAYSGNGGAIYSNANSEVICRDNSKLLFTSNYAAQGGSIYSSSNSSILFDENATGIFENNAAISGRAYAEHFNTFQKNLKSVINNKERQNGGAINLENRSTFVLKGNVAVKFHDNKATSGGAIYACDNSNVTMTETSASIFGKNSAKFGGTIYLTGSDINFHSNCSVTFHNNTAWQDGGAIYLDEQYVATFSEDVNIKFDYNSASDYGGAIYSKFSHQSKIYFYATILKFSDNHAQTAGNSVFINVATSCNSSCLKNGIIGINERSLQNHLIKQHISTSPRKLTLYQPAICADDSNSKDEECDSYHVNNVMLGEEVLINACMYDYYDQPSDDARFIVSNTAHNEDSYYIPGSKSILVSCNNSIYGIKLLSNKNNTLPILPYNYSMTISLYVNRQSETKNISVNLTVELGDCHPGFWYNQKSRTCECYNASDIVFCSGSSSTIKRGYWFGNVAGKPTVTFCPINYCNFTCCETSNGYYQLSPVRDNQCGSHRSGTACGSCKEDYTLSFDSAECVHVKNCTIGMTMLVLALTMLYWITIFVVVFLMMHFKLNIGNLYAITYYYSVVDLLLSQNWYLSNKLSATINAISSIAKMTPQFLGEFCFIKNMSGIDQQFIHYSHSTAVSLFLVTVAMLARRSHRLSAFVSKSIIRVICCLLLLSYTSVATTSLLLMRPLIFHDVDKVYTYLSPDVGYFHGRHLAYAIVAVLFTIVIVIGLPLLLALEPFLNSKINFSRIKPLLDQFQCCYKDQYRCFAAYYMICRLIIIIIIIISSSNDYIFQFLLITACVMMALIHQILRPYSHNMLNILDGTILHLLILISVLPLVDVFGSFNSYLLVGIAFILVLLPLVSFIAMTLITNRKKIKRFVINFKCSHFHVNSKSYSEIPLDDIGKSHADSSTVIDESRKINATVCAV